ncbi:MAG: SRPBCC family protein [Ilumatobacteraceae bacterium]
MADGNENQPTAHTDERIERGIRFVPAEPQAVFDLLADPSQHPVIDGSGTVKAASDDLPDRLTLGSKFGMSMKMGVPYSITNEVVEFDEPNVIAWRHTGHHVWRYRLRPVDGGTEVTEEFDWGVARVPLALKLTGTPKRNAKAIEATLDRLAAHFADAADTGTGNGTDSDTDSTE